MVGHAVFLGSELDRYKHRLSYLYFKYHVVLWVTDLPEYFNRDMCKGL